MCGAVEVKTEAKKRAKNRLKHSSARVVSLNSISGKQVKQFRQQKMVSISIDIPLSNSSNHNYQAQVAKGGATGKNKQGKQILTHHCERAYTQCFSLISI